jgi:hypothetical protein
MMELPMRSVQNLENVLVVQASQLNALQVAMADQILITTAAVKILETRLVPSVKKTAPTTVKKSVTKKSPVKASK